MKSKFLTKIVLVMFCLTLGLTVMPTAPVQAAADSLEDLETRLENLLMREKIALNNQADRLERTDNIIAKIEAFIRKMLDQGLDAKDLEKALAGFIKGVQVVQEYHDQTASILAAPDGFDAEGKVIDRTQALKTVHTAGNALRRAHLELTEATINLRAAVRKFIEENRPVDSNP